MKKYSVTKSEEEWKNELSDHDYRITRQKGTEKPFDNEFWNKKDDGSYHCKCCGELLFGSDSKFESGSGWPSFYEAADKSAIDSEPDTSFGMKRTEILCNNCGSHLGHLFDDGPVPTGLRYCVNSASLKFSPSSENKDL